MHVFERTAREKDGDLSGPFVGIPEFQSFGTVVGQQIAGALAGKMTVDAALKASQAAANKAVKQAGLQK